MACPAKRGRAAASGAVDETIQETCGETRERYGMKFLEMGAEGDRVCFPARPAPPHGPTKTAAAARGAAPREAFGGHTATISIEANYAYAV
jgi:hypothetical protein